MKAVRLVTVYNLKSGPWTVLAPTGPRFTVATESVTCAMSGTAVPSGVVAACTAPALEWWPASVCASMSNGDG